MSFTIQLDKEDIKKALRHYIVDLVSRIDYLSHDGSRFTKFDSDNDFFLGELGEIAFAKFLTQMGYRNDVDFFKTSDKSNDPSFSSYFTQVNGVKYDRFDFGINMFYGADGHRKSTIKVDVKTQKYVGKYNDSWQFSVNSNTIDKLENDKNRIHLFCFIFSKYGINDIIIENISKKNKDQLREIYKNIEQYMRVSQVDVDILGTITPEKFTILSDKFEKGEIYRINTSNSNLNAYSVHSPMHRIFIRYLENVEKTIPNLTIGVPSQKLDRYRSKTTDSLYVKNTQDQLIPIGKIYYNSQHRSYSHFIKSL